MKDNTKNNDPDLDVDPYDDYEDEGQLQFLVPVIIAAIIFLLVYWLTDGAIDLRPGQ